MICHLRACLGCMREFPLVGQGGLEDLVNSLGDARVRFDHLEHVQQDCPEITEINLRILPARDLHEPFVHKPELALKLWREWQVVGRRTHQHASTRAGKEEPRRRI